MFLDFKKGSDLCRTDAVQKRSKRIKRGERKKLRSRRKGDEKEKRREEKRKEIGGGKVCNYVGFINSSKTFLKM